MLKLCAAREVVLQRQDQSSFAATVRTAGAHLVSAFAWPLLLQAGGLASLDGAASG